MMAAKKKVKAIREGKRKRLGHKLQGPEELELVF